MKKREGTILGSVKENQVDELMKQFDLSAYEAMDIVLKHELNKILESALIANISDKKPNNLKDIAISLRVLTKRENER